MGHGDRAVSRLSVTDATGITVIVGLFAAFALVVLAIVWAVLEWTRGQVEDEDPFREPWGDV